MRGNDKKKKENNSLLSKRVILQKQSYPLLLTTLFQFEIVDADFKLPLNATK